MKELQNENDLREFLKNEVEKQKGICHPVRAGVFERLLVRKVSCKRLHPNPADEFSMPEIGPNMGIVSDYVKQYLLRIARSKPIMDEPLFVQKINTGGYMVLNGHHRWAAAMRLGIRRLKVAVINTTNADDIRKMLEESKNDRRVTFDLDEVIFCPAGYPFIERSSFPIRLGIQRSRLRLGIPAVFSYFSNHGYDIWVYSSNYYSVDDIDRYFRHYSVWINGIITGKQAAKHKPGNDAAKTGNEESIERMASLKYRETVHIDGDMMLVTYPDKKDFKEIPLGGFSENWSRNVIEEAGKLSGPD